MLVGNKTDLGHIRTVSTDEAKAFAKRENLLYMETSARDGLNVNNAFTELFTQIHRKGQFPPTPPPTQEPQIKVMPPAPVIQSELPPPRQPKRRKRTMRDKEDAMIDCIEWICEQQAGIMNHLGLNLTRSPPPCIRYIEHYRQEESHTG
ncbi:Ras-related protein RabA1f [Tanacetum coccineum]